MQAPAADLDHTIADPYTDLFVAILPDTPVVFDEHPAVIHNFDQCLPRKYLIGQVCRLGQVLP